MKKILICLLLIFFICGCTSSEKKESEAKITESTETKNSEEVEIQETIENKIVEQNNEEKENLNIAETEPIILEN